jgi:hypothetical protein
MLILLLAALSQDGPTARSGSPMPARASHHWAFRPVKRPALPAGTGSPSPPGSGRLGPIDAFLQARIEKQGVPLAPQAAPQALLRRLSLALTGLPPTLEDQEAFARDTRPGAYERLVDRLLASPRFGERWGRHWLDVARYADSNGYERDGDKPGAWKYRDWVIRALNDDLPYHRFVMDQLAGDESPWADRASVAATTFLRLGPWDDEPADPANDRFDQLDDIVSTTTEAFLGLTLSCARCHDHKFEPLTQVDYYRVLAVFAPLVRPQNGRAELDRPALPLARRAEHAILEYKLAELKRSSKLSDPSSARVYRKEVEELQKKLAAIPRAYVFDEKVPPPATHLLRRGRAALKGPEVQPGVPAVLAAAQPTFPAATPTSTQRRLTFARWIASPDNPLTARVIVNRLWHYHFGRGIVATPGDLGLRGERPTHPELLDWLASELIASGWSLKHIHRLIVTSAAYRRSSQGNDTQRRADPDNLFLARFPFRRLEVEAIRDSILATSGKLDSRMYGPGVRPPIPRAALQGHPDAATVWKGVTEDEAARRTIYVHVKRSITLPLLEALDLCDTARSAPRRSVTTVAPQALMLYNGSLVTTQARALAERLEREAGPSVEAQVDRAFRLLFARLPGKEEKAAVVAHVSAHGLAQACRVLYNLNELVYPD